MTPRRCLVTAVLLVSIGTLFAQTPSAETGLFLLSEPIGASIRIDGSLRDERTPAIIFLPFGEHEVEIRKLGYGDGRATVMVEEGEVTTLFWDLAEGSIALALPEESEAVVSETRTDLGDRYVNLSDGTYRIARDDALVRIDPVYPRQSGLNTARTVTVVSAIAAGILSLDYVLSGEGPIYEQPLLMTSYVSTLTAGSVALGLGIRRNRYLAREHARVQPTADLTAAARQELTLAEAQLAAGDLAEARATYVGLIERYPDSQFVSEALFRVARIYTLTNEIPTAILTLRKAIEDYPHPDTYDRACKSLADLLFAQERFEESLSYLDRMLFLDPLYTPEEIEEYRQLIRRAQEARGIEAARGVVLGQEDAS
jgi:tetratricopeptide (TPR) repeat protein